MFENESVTATQGSGRIIDRKPFSDYVYQKIKVRDDLKPNKIDREPYTGPVVDLTKAVDGITLAPVASQNGAFHSRATKSGVRNLQDSSFAFSGQQWDDQPSRSSTRVINPPGGKSSGIF